MRPRTEIIVLKYHVEEFEKRCFNHIIDKTLEETPYRLTFYDTRGMECHFSKIWNQLIKHSDCEWIVIMDSDAFIHTENWLGIMQDTYREHNASCVVPSIDRNGSIIQRTRRGEGAFKTRDATPVVGLYHKSIFEKVGYFDESPEFAIFGQDSEWMRRADERGFTPVIQTNVFVEHIGNASTMKASHEGKLNFAEENQKANKRLNEVEHERELSKK